MENTVAVYLEEGKVEGSIKSIICDQNCLLRRVIVVLLHLYFETKL